jgi:integrase
VAHVEDRWHVTGPGGGKTRTARFGTGRRWRARYLDPEGRERSKSFDRKADATAFVNSAAAKVDSGTWTDPVLGKITLRDYIWEWAAGQPWDASTRDAYERRIRCHIDPGLGGRTLARLAASPSSVTAWVNGLPVGAAYAGHILGVLSACLSAAVDDGLIARNPCQARSVRAPRASRAKIVPWTAAQVEAVRAALPERYQAMADIGAGLGMRQGEILGLPADAAEFLRKRVHVRLQVRRIGGTLVFAPPKRGRDRFVPLPRDVAMALAAHMAAFPPVSVTLPWLQPGGGPRTEQLVFTGLRGHALLPNAVNEDIWRPARIAAGLPDTRDNGMHSLRHHYASTLLAGGVDIKRLAAYLGHHDPAFSLRVYAHLMPDGDELALQAIEAARASHGPVTAQDLREDASDQAGGGTG